ncbi:lactadherin-like [Diadema setosum]|uniref:lactadherin-like n=1 Tax=Diadema setosum TaxID=31175 RepID=UPI003B3AA923
MNHMARVVEIGKKFGELILLVGSCIFLHILGEPSLEQCPFFSQTSCPEMQGENGDMIQHLLKLLPSEQEHRLAVPPELKDVLPSAKYMCAPPACLSNPCQHGGTCEETMEGFKCTCPTGYQGVTCTYGKDRKNGFIRHVEVLGGMDAEGFVAIATNSDPSHLYLPSHRGWTVNASRLVCNHLGFKAVYSTFTGNYSSDDVSGVGVFTCPPEAANITDCYLLEEGKTMGPEATIRIMFCNVSSCWTPGFELGLQSGVLPDSSLTASSCSSSSACADKARLNGPSAWKPSTMSSSAWLQVNLLSTFLVTGIITQGREGSTRFVTTFGISSSTDGSTWTQYRDPLTGSNMVFRGNFDSATPVKHYFRRPIKGQYIRFQPLTFNNEMAVRLELLGYGPIHSNIASFDDEGCKVERGDPLGVGDGSIPDDRLTSSSTYKGQTNFYGVTKGRLDLMVPGPDGGSWTAQSSDSDPWVKIDIGQTAMVTGVITQGSYHWDNWVTSIFVSTSSDDVTWHFVARCGTRQIFPANIDRNTHVTSLFDSPINARYVKIHSHTYHDYMSMRFEVLGFLI